VSRVLLSRPGHLWPRPGRRRSIDPPTFPCAASRRCGSSSPGGPVLTPPDPGARGPPGPPPDHLPVVKPTPCKSSGTVELHGLLEMMAADGQVCHRPGGGSATRRITSAESTASWECQVAISGATPAIAESGPAVEIPVSFGFFGAA
jgi:hypothetical protein